MLGWDRDKIKDYAALQKISPEAWDIIGETFEKSLPSSNEGASPLNGEISPFNAWLLRDILDLKDEQQLELVQELATNKKFTKGMFKTRAENYQTRNEAKAYALEKLGALHNKDAYQLYLVQHCNSSGQQYCKATC